MMSKLVLNVLSVEVFLAMRDSAIAIFAIWNNFAKTKNKVWNCLETNY